MSWFRDVRALAAGIVRCARTLLKCYHAGRFLLAFAAEFQIVGQTDMTSPTSYLVDAHDKPGLLVAVARALVGDAEISFEGDLSCCRLQDLSHASPRETEVLRRNTISPTQDFVVLPLEADTVSPILAEVLPGGRLAREILHVQISKHSHLAFGAYDNFHRECTVAFGPELLPILDSLKANAVIRSYTPHLFA